MTLLAFAADRCGYGSKGGHAVQQSINIARPWGPQQHTRHTHAAAAV